jgi:hypothetical protein
LIEIICLIAGTGAKYRKACFEISWSVIWKESEIEIFRKINIVQTDDENYPGYVDPLYEMITRNLNMD